jgi:hypothetical protein
MSIEKRTITLEVTKEKLEQNPQRIDPGEGECGAWFIEIRGGHTYTCRICYGGFPTSFPYKQCIQLPD